MFGWLRRVDWRLVYNVIGLCVSNYVVVKSASGSTFLRSHLNAATTQSVFAIAVLACALLLYHLRKRWRRYYAALEIVFGILAGVYAANQFYAAPDPDSELKGFLATVGGIYIIVRGLDNWSLRNKV